MTTRVSSDKGDTNLGSEISGQILKQPKALMIAAGFMMALAVIPGFPKPPFLILAAVFGFIGYALWSNEAQIKEIARGQAAGGGIESATMDTPVKGHKVVSGGGIDSYALTLPVVLECGKLISIEIQKTPRGGFIDQMIPKMRQALYADLGVRFPGVHVRTDSPILDKDEYSIHLNEVPLVRGKVLEDMVLTNETEDNLKRYNLPYTSYKNSLGLPSLWVP